MLSCSVQKQALLRLGQYVNNHRSPCFFGIQAKLWVKPTRSHSRRRIVAFGCILQLFHPHRRQHLLFVSQFCLLPWLLVQMLRLRTDLPVLGPLLPLVFHSSQRSSFLFLSMFVAMLLISLSLNLCSFLLSSTSHCCKHSQHFL